MVEMTKEMQACFDDWMSMSMVRMGKFMMKMVICLKTGFLKG